MHVTYSIIINSSITQYAIIIIIVIIIIMHNFFYSYLHLEIDLENTHF